MDVRPALFPGEDGLVELFGQGRVGGQDDRPARPVQGLVGGRGDDVGIADRRGHHAGGNQSAQVRDVSQQVCADAVGDAAKGLPVGDPGVGRVTADDHLRLALFRQFHDGFVVDLLGFRVDGVVDDLVELAGAVGGRTV